jgi:geranylgeranyl diphosphate synthase type I
LDHAERAYQLNPDDDDLRALLRSELCGRWPDSARGLDAIDRYALLPTGELLRSTLVLRAALAVGGDLDRVLPAAIGVECVHVGERVHHDLIDHDDISHGKVAVHRRFGPERAIVAANALYFSGFALIAECRARGATAEQVTEVIRIQADAGVERSRGAELELAIGGDPDHAPTDYLRMVRLTSAVPLAAACRIGAVLGGADAEQTRALAGFGENLGMALAIRADRALVRLADQFTGRARRKLRRLPVGSSRDRLQDLTRSRPPL